MYSVTFVTQPNQLKYNHMSSIDKLALTCRVLYDQRVLELRKEIETLKVKYFFRVYTSNFLKDAMFELNIYNIDCSCRGCKTAGRMYDCYGADEEAACTFGPWFDNVLHERGFVVLRHKDLKYDFCDGPFDMNELFELPSFVTFDDDIDCHLFEGPMANKGTTDVRWGEVGIGEGLWSVESINNEWIKKFERIFCESESPLSSPPTPPTSPKMAPQPPPPLRITTTIDQGLKLQELTIDQGLKLQELEKQVATQAAEIQTLKEQCRR